MSLFTELKRRNVFRVVFAYLVVAWLLLQIGDTLAPALWLPEWTTSLLAFFLILGFPLAIFFAWAYEMTPGGLKLEKEVDSDESVASTTGRKLDFLIIALLAIAVAYFAFDKFVTDEPQQTDQLVAEFTTRLSIAVLPFVNMSADPEQDYFSDGLSEELLHLLAKIPELRVTSRSSAFSFKGKDFTIADVGRQLNVAHVLEGSVRKSGNQIRITAQLINVQGDVHIWSETWDRSLDNVFEIQDEIAIAVTSALKIQLVDELPRSYVTDPEAYGLFFKTSELMSDYSEAGLEQAERLLLQVLDIDPDYAPALTRLSRVYYTQGVWEYRPRAESSALARLYAQKAVEVDPSFADAYLELATSAYEERHDVAAAERYIEKALAIDSQNLNAIIQAAEFSARRGETKLLVEVARELVKTDPLSAIAHRRLGHALMYTGQYDESIEALRKVQQINPDSIVNHTTLGQALFLDGQYEEALSEFEQEPIEGFRHYGRALVHHRLGNAAESQAAIDALIAMDNGEWAAQIAQAQAVRDELDSAIKWLNRGYDLFDLGVNIAAIDPFLENLHGNPRYGAFLVRLQSAPE